MDGVLSMKHLTVKEYRIALTEIVALGIRVRCTVSSEKKTSCRSSRYVLVSLLERKLNTFKLR